MVGVVLLSLTEIGRNGRLLRYATELTKDHRNRVWVVGFDGADIPLSFDRHPQVSFHFLFPFWDYPTFLFPIFWPMKFLFLTLQLLGIGFALTGRIDAVLSLSASIVTEPLAALLISKFHRAALIFDIVACDWFETTFRKRIGKRLLSAATLRITSTHSMELLLRLSGLSSICLPDVPDPLFRSEQSAQKAGLCSILKLERDSTFVGVFVETFPSTWHAFLSDVADRVPCTTVFLIFGSVKMVPQIHFPTKRIKNCEFVFVPKQYDLYPIALASCLVGVSLDPAPRVMTVSAEILEMQACGVPVLTVRSGCAGNFVEDGKNGFLAMDEHELKERLVRILANSAEAMRAVSRQPRDFDNEFRKAWGAFSTQLQNICDQPFAHRE
jgi:glycosyltransferase involved in cell wall biosynthesis